MAGCAKMTVAVLKEELKKRGLDATGLKAALVARKSMRKTSRKLGRNAVCTPARKSTQKNEACFQLIQPPFF